MGCAIAQMMLFTPWYELEPYKKNCKVVGTGGFNIFTQEEKDLFMSTYNVSLYAYGEENYDEENNIFLFVMTMCL